MKHEYRNKNCLDQLVYELDRDLERWRALREKNFKDYFYLLNKHKKEDEAANIINAENGSDPNAYN